VAEAELWLDYDGLRCAPWPARAPVRQFVTSAQGLVELHREPAAELAAAHAWAEFATPRHVTTSDITDPPHHWQLGGARSEDPKTLLAGWLTQDFAPLRELGFIVELDEDWLRRTQRVDDISASLESSDPRDAGGWLDLSLGFDIDGRRINLLPLLPQVLAGLNLDAANDPAALPEHFWLQTDDNHWWQLPSAPLRPWLQVLIELLGEREGDFGSESLSLSPVEALRLGADQAEFGQNGHAALREVLAPRQAGVTLPPPPEGLQAKLRPYQQQGWAWMSALAKHRLGGVLADDMGLGKTLQTLTHLLDEQRRGLGRHPSLIVVPTSLVGNWHRECERFAPGLRMLVLHGAGRHARHAELAEHDVVLTTYPLLQRDLHVLVEQSWHALVLDEAQTLKNARTHTAKAARQLHAHHRIALTGTPMENHLGELWSLFDLVLPGYLGREPRFTELYRTPIEKQRDSRRLALLRRRLMPFMLRRDKRMVASELPPKIEQVVRVQLGAAQANLYETIRAAAEASVQKALAAKGLARSQIFVLDALLKLRQACCDPRLVKLKNNRQKIGSESAKLTWLLENLPQMLEEGRRILLFSQFTSMLALIEAALASADLRWTLLTGDTLDREAAITRFTSGEVPLFLISLKAGGTGLNLPQADTVIHFDPWWNPAAENQATDRAHRLGQTQTVFVYKLVADGTLEERILAMQARKAELARSVQGAADAEDTSARLSEADLNWLLQPLGAATLGEASSVSTENSEMASA
ncbi:DEAD/DEAH box helicase, partial [Ideonella azotifigens]